MFYNPSRVLFVTLIIVTIAFALQGCVASKALTKVVYETKYVHPEMPSEVTDPVKLKRPIDKQEYLAMSADEKESYLTEYNIEAISSLKMCNAKLLKVQSILDKQKGAYSESKPSDKNNSD